MDKLFLKTFLSKMMEETLAVQYWDGTIEKYGQGEPVFKIIFHQPLSKKEILDDPYLTFGEAYMDGIIDIEGGLQQIIEAISRNTQSFLHKNKLLSKIVKMKPTSIKKAKEDIQYHYDLGNDFYKLWLDKTMTYSCGYFSNPNDTLYDAQMNKVKYTLKKLNLKKGDKLLDIGSGWGTLIIEAAKTYGTKALGITLSKEQYAKTKEKIKEENLEALVDVKLIDYRDLAKTNEKFDRIVSIGMLEHVGRANYPVYMETINKLLNQGGVSVLHCITAQNERKVNSWSTKYIFPGGHLPSIRELIYLMPEYDFHLLTIESLRRHYAKTLEHWAANFETQLDKISETKDERFIRMWRLYLQGCAASFNYGTIDIHQFVFTKGLNNDFPMARVHL
ncbi:cyclopropane-fatty-acyl-phospholipid synthase [Clostridium aestuarii]|uniref:Cyclopropane-fatty-acyl-phospholipid synthase n=1 Tax=Clostridium aestuarii TaxID=338193 RepID=A0ABT4D124_9CLOT|nr:cyclopropane-fatty-acyl-phospholipid synthase family protein [Clostridium aestuarii]MCY6484938.1 cyclopropane-fatty-acyl-phospholipid synthase [Clostridium aestuarii]